MLPSPGKTSSPFHPLLRLHVFGWLLFRVITSGSYLRPRRIFFVIVLSFNFPPWTKRQHPPPYAPPQQCILSIIPSIAASNYRLIVAYWEKKAATWGQRIISSLFFISSHFDPQPQTKGTNNGMDRSQTGPKLWDWHLFYLGKYLLGEDSSADFGKVLSLAETNNAFFLAWCTPTLIKK